MKVSPRQNVINIIKKKGYDYMPSDFSMTPLLEKKFKAYVKANNLKFKPSPYGYIWCRNVTGKSDEFYRSLYKEKLKDDTNFDIYGVALEAGSEACMHLRKFYHPLKDAETMEELKAYPFPVFKKGIRLYHKIAVAAQKLAGKFIIGNMQMTIWEQSWYVRSMESLMMDMLAQPEMADYILDKVTDNAITDAENYALAGVDAIYLGDDIGMQNAVMMSDDLYVEFLKPRLKKVIDAARKINPNIIVFYHSCGYVEPFIHHLIEVGVDVLNPVQPECMDFKEIFAKYGDKLSFCGTIGTQTVMPFGTPDEVTRQVTETLDFVGKKGGLLITPTHVLEPEVPAENVVAYIRACENYKPKK